MQIENWNGRKWSKNIFGHIGDDSGSTGTKLFLDKTSTARFGTGKLGTEFHLQSNTKLDANTIRTVYTAPDIKLIQTTTYLTLAYLI